MLSTVVDLIRRSTLARNHKKISERIFFVGSKKFANDVINKLVCNNVTWYFAPLYAPALIWEESPTCGKTGKGGERMCLSDNHKKTSVVYHQCGMVYGNMLIDVRKFPSVTYLFHALC